MEIGTKQGFLPRNRVLFLLAAIIVVAGVIYFTHLGRASLDDAEAYSAYIASRPTVDAVLAANLKFDPGKPGLYALLMHGYCTVFGTGEPALRAFSGVFGLANVVLVFALAAELFGAEAGVAAAAIWAFNPLQLLLARWARMYAMLIALALAELLAFRRTQEKPRAGSVAALAILGAAMLYTHSGALLIFGAEVALLIRDWWRGRPIGAGCLGLLIAIVLFAPALATAMGQIGAALVGHRFDWIGASAAAPLVLKAAVGVGAVVVGCALVFGPPLGFDRAAFSPGENPEPMRWCAIWLILPLIALGAGSVVIHPMFKVRYVAPSMAGVAILIAAGLNLAGAKARNLGAVAIAGACLLGLLLSQTVLRGPPYELWRDIAAAVSADGASGQPIFFEAGNVMTMHQAAGLDPDALVRVLPDGFLRVPFDYYFAGTNPRRAINPFRPRQAEATIAAAARGCGGAWLVSHLPSTEAQEEMPARDAFTITRVAHDTPVSLYHIVPRAPRG